MNKKEQMEQLKQAIGQTAEMALMFFRAVLGAGGTQEEARYVTQAYIGAAMYGKGGAPQKEGDS